MMLRLTVIFVTICFLSSFVAAGFKDGVFRAEMPHKTKHAQAAVHSKAPPSFQTFYFDSPLDHFDFTENRKFKLRFLYSAQHFNNSRFRAGSTGSPPLLFYTGNEGNIELFVNNSGALYDLAPRLGAAIVFAEHRYYGQSLPFGKASYRNASTLAYFTAAQVLADYANLIKWLLNKEHGGGWLPENTPVVAFGGSYGGMLAGWLRQTYPNRVCGALAASAPVAQFTGLTACGAYSRTLTSAYGRSSAADGSHCVSNIRASWSALNRVAASKDGLLRITKLFHLCRPLDAVQKLSDFLSEMYSNLAMCNYPYPAQFLADLPAWPVREFCRPLAPHAFSDDLGLVTALAAGLQVFTNYTRRQPCLDLGSGASPQGLDDQGWSVQSCVDMTMPMCNDGKHDFFEPSAWNFTSYAADCRRQFGLQPRPFWAAQHFWGRSISAASNIIWSNGALDPWSTGGVLPQGKVVHFMKGLTGSIPCPGCLAVLLDEGAHHVDLRSRNPRDPPALTAMREMEYKFIVQWTTEWRRSPTH